ncbi:MAG: DMT family transporter [Gemmatimonadaceae bacterium]|nr:DMT family transporter [Gemmatimonadaceae bacterium]
MSPSNSDRLRIIAAATLFSTGGAAIKATALTGWQVASFRSGLAALAVFLLVPAARRGWSPRVAAVSVVYALTMVLFVSSNKATTAANAIFLQSTAPLYILVLAPLLLKEKVRRSDYATMAALAVGLVLVVIGLPPASATAPNPVLGNGLALVSGVSWALTLMGLRWLGASDGGTSATLSTVVGGNALAFLLCLPFALPVVNATAVDAAVVGYLGLVQIGLAYVLMTRGISGVPAVEASMLLLLEPALNPIWAWAVHGERPGTLPLIGGAVIMVAMVVRARQGAEVTRAAQAEERSG